EVHHDLDEVERVGAEVFLEGGFFGDLALFDAELFAQRALDLLENLLTRVCHFEPLLWGRRIWSAPMLPRCNRTKKEERAARQLPAATRSGMCSSRWSTIRCSTPRAASRTA